MTAILKADREPVEIAKRRMTAKRKNAIYDRQRGFCAACGQVITLWPFDIDHVIPIAIGGSDDDSNCEALCKPCHSLKTKADVKAIAKAKRLAGETGNAPKRKINSPGFSLTLRKKMNGKVVRV